MRGRVGSLRNVCYSIVALRALLIGGFVALAVSSPARQQQNASQNHQEGGKQTTRPTAEPTIGPSVGTPSSELTRATEKDVSQSDHGDVLRKRFVDALIASWPLVVIGIPGILAALRTLNAIKRQTEILIDSERAWILADPGIINDDFEPDASRVEFFELAPPLKNYGKTPARIVEFAINACQVSTPDKLPPEPEYRNTQTVDIMLPPDLPIQPLHIMIEQSDFINIRQGNPTLYVYGFIKYVDFGGEPRESRFCFVYYVPSGFTSVKRGFYIPPDAPLTYTRNT